MPNNDSTGIVFNKSKRNIVMYSLILKEEHFSKWRPRWPPKNLILTYLCSAIRYTGKESSHAVIV